MKKSVKRLIDRAHKNRRLGPKTRLGIANRYKDLRRIVGKKRARGWIKNS